MPDVIIVGVLVICIAASLLYMRKRKKSGQSGCGSGCGGCKSSSSCSEHH